MSFNPTTLSETIQRILLGEATLSFDDNEHINVASENGLATTVQRMDERLEKLEDLLKSCQLSRTAYPTAIRADSLNHRSRYIYTNDQPIHDDTRNFIYADYLCVTAQHTSFKEVYIVETLGELTHYYSLRPNQDNSQITAFLLRNKGAKRSLIIKWKNSDLGNTAYHKYLGVTLDRTPSSNETYRTHTTY